MKYRPEIDGLRALAILPVVFFHYRVPGFAGGFVGVDVFFVISGYLITSLIAGEMGDGHFSIIHFYERRIRRIFPALFAMLAIATAVALFLLFPDDLTRYAKSLTATAGFASNFEFWREAGYFDVASDQKPLLHLWSIAVEEQFYLLFPAFLLLLGRVSQTGVRAPHLPLEGRSKSQRDFGWGFFRYSPHPIRLSTDRPPREGEVGNAATRRLGFGAIGIIAVLLLSFAFSVWGTQHAKDTAFYLLPSRAWELMLGAIVAIGAVPPFRNPVLKEAGALAGLALVAAAVFGLKSTMPFPGALALLPCVGTALVIHSTGKDDTAAGRVLSLRPLVFVGLVSYSLYLWHWPLLVFAKYALFRDLTFVERGVLMAASFALAVISWRFVERPFRRPIRRVRLFPAAASAMAVTLACGIVATQADGFPQRLSPRLQRILAEQDDAESHMDSCFPMTARDVEQHRLCSIGSASAKPSFLLWGDSHADAIVPPVEAIAKKADRAGLLAGGASCLPLAGITTPVATCRPFNDAVMKVAMRPGITDVILEARWAKYADGATYGDEPKGHIVLSDDTGEDVSAADNHAVFARGLERTIRVLIDAGKKVTIVAAVPEVGWPVPAVLARRALAHDNATIDVSFDKYMQRQSFVMQAFARMHQRFGVTVIYPHEALCSNGSCAVSLNGIPLYRDEHHLSVYGALKLEPLMGGLL